MKQKQRAKRRLALVGAQRQLAYWLLAKGVSDAEVCEALNISPNTLSKAKTPYFLKRVESMRLGARQKTTKRMCPPLCRTFCPG
jgi:hypothetical protein